MEPGAQTQQISLRRAADLADALGVGPDEQIVSVLRLRMLDGRPTMVEHLNYTEQVGRLLFQIDTDAVSITEYLTEHGHPIAGVQHEIDAMAADERDAALLRVTVATPLLRLSRISRDAAGPVFEATPDRYLGDVDRFTVSGSRISADGHYLRAVAG